MSFPITEELILAYIRAQLHVITCEKFQERVMNSESYRCVYEILYHLSC